MLAADSAVRAYPDGHDELGALFARFVKGIFDINADSYTDDGIPFLRILNLRRGVIDESNLARIPEAIHQSERKTELRRGDIVLSKTACPAASLVTVDFCNTSQDTIATTLSSYGLNHYKPEAIVAYLNSSIGEQLLWRQFQGNVQLHLSLDDGRKVPIPRLSPNFQANIALFFQNAESARKSSLRQFEVASRLLERALGLENWQAPELLSYVRNSSDTFAARRLDAEFFNPGIDQLLKRLSCDGQKIRDVAPARKERFTRNETGEFYYIEIGALNSDGTAESQCILQREAPSRATQHVRTNDVITSTVRPNRRLSALISEQQDGFVCSSGFVVLQPKQISGDVLVTYLRLPIICKLMDLYTSASMYPAISESDLLNLPVPKFSTATEKAVEQSLQSARLAKQRAAHLLESAKRAVEIAIKQSEEAALTYLEANS